MALANWILSLYQFNSKPKQQTSSLSLILSTKSIRFKFPFLLILIIYCTPTAADLRFVCPRPVSPKSDILLINNNDDSGRSRSPTAISPSTTSASTTPQRSSTDKKFPTVSPETESTTTTENSTLSVSDTHFSSNLPVSADSSTEATFPKDNQTEKPLTPLNETSIVQTVTDSEMENHAPTEANQSERPANTRVRRDAPIDIAGVCGVQDLENAHVTDVHPGLMSLIFEETTFISDSPFRLILLQVEEKGTIESSSSCLLLDFIPHNNHIVVTEKCSRKKNDYPLGICEESRYQLTVKIPDVPCENCILMLQQVVPKPDHGVCDFDNTNETEKCATYISCARIKLRPTSFGVNKSLNDCANYLDNLPGDWPYRPQEYYQTEDGNALKLDLLHSNLHVDMSKQSRKQDIERLEILHENSVIWNTTFSSKARDKRKRVDAVWEDISPSDKNLLKANQLVLNVVGSKESQASEIHFKRTEFAAGQLSGLHDLYSYSGWLVSRHYLGLLAEDPIVALPSGHCAPTTRSFVSVLQSIHVQSHGIVGLTIMEDRAYITAVLHTEKEEVQTITISGPDLVAIPSIKLKLSPNFNGVVQVALDISAQLRYIDTAGFLTTVEVDTDKEDAVLVGDLEEGMYVIFRDASGAVHGMASLQPTQGKWIQIQLVLTAEPPSPIVVSASLSGPEGMLLDLSREKVFCLPSFVCMETFLHEVSSEMLLYLKKGLVYLYVETETSYLSGQVTDVTNKYCDATGSGCFGIELGKKSKPHFASEEVEETQSAAFTVDRANVLHFSVLAEDVKWAGSNHSVVLVKDQIQLLHPIALQDSATLANAKIASGQLPLCDSLELMLLLSGPHSSKIQLVTLDDQRTVFSQPLPQLSRSTCIHSKTLEVGSDEHTWSMESEPLSELYAVVKDYIKFVMDNGTTLYMMNSKSHSQHCDFSEAETLQSQGDTFGHSLYLFDLEHAGVYFFSDVPSCNTSHPARLVVHVVEPGHSVMDQSHDDWCSQSVYSAWRDQQLAKWREPSISGPILIGLLIGLCTAGIIVIWHGIRAKRGDSGFAGGSSNVFVRF